MIHNLFLSNAIEIHTMVMSILWILLIFSSSIALFGSKTDGFNTAFSLLGRLVPFSNIASNSYTKQYVRNLVFHNMKSFWPPFQVCSFAFVSPILYSYYLLPHFTLIFSFVHLTYSIHVIWASTIYSRVWWKALNPSKVVAVSKQLSNKLDFWIR